MTKTSLPEVRRGPHCRLDLCAIHAIESLQCSSRTFYKYVKRLGIKAHKQRGRRERYYSWDDLNRIRVALRPAISEWLIGRL